MWWFPDFASARNRRVSTATATKWHSILKNENRRPSPQTDAPDVRADLALLYICTTIRMLRIHSRGGRCNVLEHETGIEPATWCLESVRSAKLSYSCG